MQTLRITTHSLAGWSTYGEQIGFVPDPIILRTGELFLNGARGTHVLERSDFDVWEALQQNIGGLLDFFDMVVTREVIPLINYGDTFDRMKIMAPLDRLLPDSIRPIEIDYAVYNAVKKGALLKLAEVDLAALARFGDIALELRAFRYEWEPALSVPDSEPAVDAAREKLRRSMEPPGWGRNSFSAGSSSVDSPRRANRHTTSSPNGRVSFLGSLRLPIAQGRSHSGTRTRSSRRRRPACATPRSDWWHLAEVSVESA